MAETQAFYCKLENSLIHGDSVAYSGFCCSQSYGLHLHMYCGLDFRLLCLVPLFQVLGLGCRKSSVFFKGDSFKGGHPHSSAGRWSLLLVHLASDPLVVFYASFFFFSSSFYFWPCFYHVLGLSSELAAVYYLLLSRHVWSISNADILTVMRVSDGGIAVVVILATPLFHKKNISPFWPYSYPWPCHSS